MVEGPEGFQSEEGWVDDLRSENEVDLRGSTQLTVLWNAFSAFTLERRRAC